MKESIMAIIATLIIGGFLVFQDFAEILPLYAFSYSVQFFIGVGLIIGAVATFAALTIRKKQSKTI